MSRFGLQSIVDSHHHRIGPPSLPAKQTLYGLSYVMKSALRRAVIGKSVLGNCQPDARLARGEDRQLGRVYGQVELHA